jgi:hypothetical protein
VSKVIRHENPAVEALMKASEKTRPGFTEARIRRNVCRLKAPKNSRSRGWWGLSEEEWCDVRIRASSETTVSNIFEVEMQESKRRRETEDEGYQEEADEAQPFCALSDERFEERFDKRINEWVFVDAVKLCGELAEKYNVVDGALVKFTCVEECDLPPRKKRSV